MSLRAAVYVILRQPQGATGRAAHRGGAVLMMRRQGGWGSGQWSLPSGHVEVEARETPIQAAAREVAEEVGVVVPEKSLTIVHAVYRTSASRQGEARTYVDFFLDAAQWTGTPANKEPAKCDAIRFVDVDTDLPDTTLPNVRRALQHWREGVAFSVDA